MHSQIDWMLKEIEFLTMEILFD